MRLILSCLILVCFLNNVTAHKGKFSQFCKDNMLKSLSCSTQLTGQQPTESDVCKVEHYASDSPECKYMDFGPIRTNAKIGGVSLKPYLLDEGYTYNFTVLNITFTNIKWKKMKIRFQPTNYQNNHCRNIVLSNNFTIDDRSVLYYDCYWSYTDGDYNNTSHILDFVAENNAAQYRGQYYFNIPNMQMLSPYVTEKEWKPFLYIEILSNRLQLHINPPPAQLKIHGYQVEVRKGCSKGAVDCQDELVKTSTLKLKNSTEEMSCSTSYNYLGNSGYFYFVVTPLHEHCSADVRSCQTVASPKINITTEEHKTLNICIASVIALVVATLFAYYIVLRMIRRYWCKDYRLASAQEIPAPTKVLVIYSPASRLHAECVASFVSYLRSEYGFEVMYDGDVSSTSHGDPYIWSEEALRLATHVLYMVGPTETTNLFNNIYEKPIGAHKDVDKLQLTMLKSYRVSRNQKDVSNVFFDHSNGPIPLETKHGHSFELLKDWQKLISHLSKNMLPKKQLMRTEKGRCFLDDLNKANKMLGSKCDKEKKILV
ncbi:hypothetical protein ACJJTC_017525 [Scirpophaga incertulas]